MLWYEVAGRVLYYISLPVVQLVLWLVYILLYILRVVLSPFIYIASSIFHLCLIPYNIAAKFEVSTP